MGSSPEEYYSCEWIEAFGLIFISAFGNDRFVSICCEEELRPGVPLGRPKETYSWFSGMHKALISEGASEDSSQLMHSENCKKCVYYERRAWNVKDRDQW